MKQNAKFKICNRWLVSILLLMLVSGIHLEMTSCKYVWSVWLHIILGFLLTGMSLYHIFLHYRYGNWFALFAKNRNITTRVLWWIFILTAVSGIASGVIWLNGYGHSHLGGIHGKIGFLMIVIAVLHFLRHKGKIKYRDV